MTNEKAIELLHRLQDEQFDGEYGDERREALEMAVRALEGDGDTISRKMAIDAMRKLPKWNIMREDYKNEGFSYDDVMFTLEKLTSAQPERKNGHWVEIGDEPYDEWECDVCGFVIDGSGCIDPEEYRDVYRFCPRCGARMER